jgi:hypothetical protein
MLADWVQAVSIAVQLFCSAASLGELVEAAALSAANLQLFALVMERAK